MDTDPTVGAIGEEQDFIRRLYSAAHSLSCDDPDCPWAQFLDQPSNVDTLLHNDALVLVLLGIIDNIGDCLDLIRILVASRSDTSRTEPSTRAAMSRDSASPSIHSHSRRGGTIIGARDILHEPPVPSLYHDQWARSPTVSPPAYASYCHGYARGFCGVPAPSPATRGSDTTPSMGGTPTPDHQGGPSRSDQEEQQRTETSTEQFFPALRTPDFSAGTPCHRLSSTDSDSSDQHFRGRFAARSDSDDDVD